MSTKASWSAAKKTNKKNKTAICAAVACALALVAAALVVFMPRGVPEGAVLTIDGYPVTAEEFALFLNDRRAATASYFYKEHGAEVDQGFWDREYGGLTPNRYARQTALDELMPAKMESILLKERGLLEDVSYGALMAEMERTNAERAEKIAAGEVVYGLSEYKPLEFYFYTRSNRWTRLLDSETELQRGKVGDTALRETYNNNLPYFSLGLEITAEKITAAGKETITLKQADIPKESNELQTIFDFLSQMTEGEETEELELSEGMVRFKVLDKEDMGSTPFEDARESVLRIYAEESLRGLIDERVSKARVKFNNGLYEALKIG